MWGPPITFDNQKSLIGWLSCNKMPGERQDLFGGVILDVDEELMGRVSCHIPMGWLKYPFVSRRQWAIMSPSEMLNACCTGKERILKTVVHV